ncbi:hypothetical protein Tco_1517146 [Tanacetum coccineum]
MVPAPRTSLVGFSGEIKWPLGQITLLVKIRDDEHSMSAWMDFMVFPVECAMVSGPEEQPILVNKVKEERVKVAINPEHPEQTVMIGSDLTEKTRSKLCNLLQKKFGHIRLDSNGYDGRTMSNQRNIC